VPRVPESEERLLALQAILSDATARRPVTREEIFEKLFVDAADSTPRKPQRVRAYTGTDEATRQKFERDKKDLREKNVVIVTTTNSDGREAYYIPDEDQTLGVEFTEGEYGAVAAALRMCSYGRYGAFQVFADGSPRSASMRFMGAVQPLYAAIRRNLRVSFSYVGKKKPRVVNPINLRIRSGVTYLVATNVDETQPKFFRLDRMVGLPEVLNERSVVSAETRSAARDIVPGFRRSEQPLVVTVRTYPAIAQLVTAKVPSAVAEKRRDGMVDLNLTFFNVDDVRTFLVHNSRTARVVGPTPILKALRDLFDGVNEGDPVDVSGLTFAPVDGGNAVATSIKILQAIVHAPDGLRVSEVAARFGLDHDYAAVLLERLSAMEPLVGFQQMQSYPTHIMRDPDDWDDSDDDNYELTSQSDDGPSDPRYVADHQTVAAGTVDLASLTVLDAVEVSVALHEATRFMPDNEDVRSALAIIDDALGSFVTIDVNAQTLEPKLRDAIEKKSRLKVTYTKHGASEAEELDIVPTDLGVLNGYSFVRAYSLDRRDWRMYRIDRMNEILASEPAPPVATDPNATDWLTSFSGAGDVVCVAMDAPLRYHFEPLPGVEWAELPDGRHVARFAVTDSLWFDELMVLAGKGAVVVDAPEALRKAGRTLAKEMRDALK